MWNVSVKKAEGVDSMWSSNTNSVLKPKEKEKLEDGGPVSVSPQQIIDPLYHAWNYPKLNKIK